MPSTLREIEDTVSNQVSATVHLAHVYINGNGRT